MNGDELILNVGVQRLMSSSSSSSSSSSNNSDSDAASDASDHSMSIDSSSGSEDDNEDEEIVQMFAAYEELLFGAPRVRVENFVETVQEKSDEEFRQDFRLHRPVAYELIEALDASGFIPNHPGGKEKKTAEFSFLMFLWFVSSDELHRTAANLFGCGTTTVFRVVRRVTEWLLTIMPDHIIWPRGELLQETSHAFAQRAGIGNCIGAIDGSHIFIEKPINYGRVYFCRKQRYSINLQAVADFDMLFTNVHCGDPGSYHDSRVLQRSELHAVAQNRVQELFPNGTFLLGDKGYIGVGKKWIVTPFKDYGNLTAEQTDFNVRVCSTRVVVEQAFGALKSRFRYLRGIMRLRDIRFAPRLVVACCILHNVCIRSGDVPDDLIQAEGGNGEDNNDHDDGNISGGEEDENVGRRLDSDEDDDSDDNDDEDVPEGDRQTLIVFRQMYPGAVIPPPRRRRANNAQHHNELP